MPATWRLPAPTYLSEVGHAHLVWLNLGLSLIAGFAAIVAGHWLGSALLT